MLFLQQKLQQTRLYGEGLIHSDALPKIQSEENLLGLTFNLTTDRKLERQQQHFSPGKIKEIDQYQQNSITTEYLNAIINQGLTW